MLRRMVLRSYRLASLSLAAMLLLAQPVMAESASTVAAQARSLLKQRQTDAAIELLEKTRDEAEPDRELAFLRGVAYQQRAMTTQGEARESALHEAEAAYREATLDAGGTGVPDTKQSQSAAVDNNLAALYASTGNDEKARAYYQRAIDASDARRGYYALNYARYLESRDVDEAVAMARLAVSAAPHSAEVRDYAGQLFYAHRIDAMLPFAGHLAQQGYSDETTRWALQCLQLGNRPQKEREAWLVLLGHNAVVSARFKQELGTLREALAPLLSDDAIGLGARQLQSVLSEPPQGRQAVRWWRDRDGHIDALNTSARDTMRELLMSLAQRAGNKAPKATEGYLNTALELGDHGVDPDAFLRLVELYVNTDSAAKIKPLMDRYQYELFSRKSEAYFKQDWPLIYHLHIALGMTYAYLGVWTSQSRFQNALFQLENAQIAAEHLNAQAEHAHKPERVVLPAVAVTKLAEGYAAIGRPDRALAVKVEGAENLQKYGYTSESVAVLNTLPAAQIQSISPELRQRIEEIKDKTINEKAINDRATKSRE
jgi:tetratricopeptide (TPR) repeat protein